jgi:hypothetical protein
MRFQSWRASFDAASAPAVSAGSYDIGAFSFAN